MALPACRNISVCRAMWIRAVVWTEAIGPGWSTRCQGRGRATSSPAHGISCGPEENAPGVFEAGQNGEKIVGALVERSGKVLITAQWAAVGRRSPAVCNANRCGRCCFVAARPASSAFLATIPAITLLVGGSARQEPSAAIARPSG